LVFVVTAVFAVVSHASSAVSSASFPLTRLMKIIPASFPVALATPFAHFGQGDLRDVRRDLTGVIPPKGVPAVVQ
jgi:hypothetical protein